MIHELWGLDDHIKDVTDRFAKQGFVALAPDLYSSQDDLRPILTQENISMFLRLRDKLPREKPISQMLGELRTYLSGEPPKTIETVQRIIEVFFGGKMPKDALVAELVMAKKYLDAQPWVRRSNLGVVGFCSGGYFSFALSASTAMDACVSFYGGNPEPIESVAKIQCPILAIYGGDDMRVNSNIDKLVAALVAHKKDFEVRVYAGAPHAFFNDARSSYHAKASRDAWKRTLNFLRSSFASEA